MSFSSSPSSPTTPKRRLSSRRGSVSALDPHAKHADLNLNPNRSSFSTLTIVRVLPTQDPPSTISLQDPPGPGQRKFHRRRGSEGTAASAPNASGSPRLSFAFSSFGGPPKDSTGRTTPPPSSPSLRSASPHRNLSNHGGSKPRLTAEQLYDLAHQAINPKYFPSAPLSSASHYPPESHSPRSSYFPVQRGHSPHGYASAGSRSPHRSPVLTPSNSALSTTSGSTVPATFTPLPPSIFLPFIDRPSEVAVLVSSPPTKKLFALLSQTFPKNGPISSSPSPPTTGNLLVANPDPSSPELSPKSPLFATPSGANTPSIPMNWSYNQLLTYLTSVTRAEAPDPLWVAHIRKCILSRSELIWERVKGALGVPPELDVDYDLDELQMHGDVFEDSSGSEDEPGVMNPQTPKTDDMEDAGRKARGHWEDWDAVMDSPVFERAGGRGSTLPAPSGKEEEFQAQVGAALQTSISSKSPSALSKTQKAYLTDSDTSQSGETTTSPTPRRRSPSPTSVPKIVQELPTPKHSQDTFDSTGQPQSQVQSVPIPGAEPPDAEGAKTKPQRSPLLVPNVDYSSSASFEYLSPQASGLSRDLSELSIEPLYAPLASQSISSPGMNPPPLSLPASLASSETAGSGLGDIMEGEEEEEPESKGDSESASGAQTTEGSKDKVDNPIDSARIHGLRISLPSSPSVTPYGVSPSSVSSSPVISHRSLSRANSEKRASGSFSLTGLTRTGSLGSIAGSNHSGSPMRHMYEYTYATSDHGGRSTDEESSEAGYDPVGDRAPGNPLFPSNFARLATGPTLAANNPSLRSPSFPPQSKYQPHLFHGLRGNRFRRGSGATSISNDFAITLGSTSASSIGGESTH